jgi:hypothetical protein
MILNHEQFKRKLCTECGVWGDSQSVQLHELVCIDATITSECNGVQLLVTETRQCCRCGSRKEMKWLCGDNYKYEADNLREKDGDLGRRFVDENGMKRFYTR